LVVQVISVNLYSNDFGVTDALSHTYNIEIAFDTTACGNDVNVNVWSLGSKEDLIMNLTNGTANTTTALAFQIMSGDDFNGIVFTVQIGDTFQVVTASYVQVS